jgi:hypothetical protein
MLLISFLYRCKRFLLDCALNSTLCSYLEVFILSLKIYNIDVNIVILQYKTTPVPDFSYTQSMV